MRCPECGRDAMQPEYFTYEAMQLDGGSNRREFRRLLRLRCQHCGNYILAQDGETPAQIERRLCQPSKKEKEAASP